MTTGVYQARFSVNLSNLKGLYAALANIAGKEGSTEFKTKIRELEKKALYTPMDILDKFFVALHDLTKLDKCPTILRKWRDYHFPSYLTERSLKLFSPVLLSDKNDVIYIEKVYPEEDYFVDDIKRLPPYYYDAVSVKNGGVTEFLNCIRAIPNLGAKVGVARPIRQTFSSRFTFSPYPLAVILWLRKVAFSTLPKDMGDFLEAAVRYHRLKEWRTSIVLSAIAVESLLAELYEDQYHRFAPKRATLGDLFNEVNKKNILPSKIKDAILVANEARIAAVHRGRSVVPDIEANNALYGATTFIMWYH